MSRATFYRLLAGGRREWLFRQRVSDGKWVRVSQSQNGVGVSDTLPDSVGELADEALHE